MLKRFLRASFGPRSLARLLYALLGLPLGWLGFGYLFAVAYPSLILLITLIGLPVLAAGVLGARLLGHAHRWLAGALLGVRVEPPPPFRAGRGFTGWIRAGLTDRTGWRAALYLLAKLPLGMLASFTAVMFWGYGLGLLGYPIWGPRSRNVGPDGEVHHGLSIDGYYFDTWPRYLMVVGVGALVLLAAPWVTRAVVWPDAQLARALLGPSESSRLREARALAVDDSAAALRRIERDLHDGAQAQLVALALKLGMAKEELGAGDTAAALELVDTAHRGAKQALVELRDLARGIHPPILDAGLEPALETLAARGAIAVELFIDLPARPSPAIESIVYFTAAELLANVAKHSRAGAAALALNPLRPGWLRLTVRDAGVGGASVTGDGGLAGLAERVRAVDGALTVDSPPGGPTIVTVDLPVRA